jgi:hypothetical protein
MLTSNDAVARTYHSPSSFLALLNRLRQFVCGLYGHEWRLRGAHNRLYLECAECARQTAGCTLDDSTITYAPRPVLRRIGATTSRSAEASDHRRRHTARSLSARSNGVVEKTWLNALVTRIRVHTEGSLTDAMHSKRG